MEDNQDQSMGARQSDNGNFLNMASSDNVTNSQASMHEVNVWFYIILWNYVTPIVLGLIFIVGTTGNSLVIIVILSKNSMRTVTNFLLLNLAIADITLLVIHLPFTAYKYIADSWPFGEWFCMVMQYFLYAIVYITVYTLVAISILRYMTVVWSVETQALRTKRNIVVFMILLWTVMLSVNIPVMLSHKVKYFGFYSFCGMHDHTIRPIYVSFFVMAYALPLLIIGFLYLLILFHLRKQNNSMLEKSSSRDRTAHAFRVVIVVIVVFAISWLPHHINALLSTYRGVPPGDWYEAFRVLSYCMSFSNSCANPLIYNYGSREFRKSFREAICCGCKKNGNQRFRSGSPENGTIAETTAMV